MARAYHNLQGWLRDLRKAIDSGEQLAYEAAELLIELDDLIDVSVDGAQSDLEDGSRGTDDVVRSGGRRPAQSDELVDVPVPRKHPQTARVAVGVRGHLEPEDGDGDPGHVAGAARMSDTELTAELSRRGLTKGRMSVPRETSPAVLTAEQALHAAQARR